MSDLFDLPFEDDAPEATGKAPAPQPVRHADACALRHRADRPAFAIISKTQFFEVWVEGEISNCRLWNTGHLYFTLKDSTSQLQGPDVPVGAPVSQVQARRRACASSRADGSRSTSPRASTRLVCEHLEPHGLGALQLAFDQLKKRLQDEGLFDAARKRPLPALPRKIGVVTSLDGAAIRDIIKVLQTALRERPRGDSADARAGRWRGAARLRAGRPGHRHACRAWTSSSSDAAADRLKTVGLQRRSGRARDRRRCPCR